MDGQDLRDWLAARVAAAAGVAVEAVAPDEPFSSYGLDSAKLITLSGDLELALGRPVDPTALFEHPTVAALAAWLDGTRAERWAGQPGRASEGAGAGALAIVGIACRMPGAPDAERFWRLL